MKIKILSSRINSPVFDLVFKVDGDNSLVTIIIEINSIANVIENNTCEKKVPNKTTTIIGYNLYFITKFV